MQSKNNSIQTLLILKYYIWRDDNKCNIFIASFITLLAKFPYGMVWVGATNTIPNLVPAQKKYIQGLGRYFKT